MLVFTLIAVILSACGGASTSAESAQVQATEAQAEEPVDGSMEMEQPEMNGPDIDAAAEKLGISAEELQKALGVEQRP